MKNRRNISVKICIKKYYPVVLEIVESFVNQTLSPSDIVIVGELHALNKIKKKFEKEKNITYESFIGDKNVARNKSISLAKGDYVIFSDYDMVASLNLLEECSKLLGKHNALVIPEVGTNSRNFFDDGSKPFDVKFGVLDEWGFYKNLKKKKPSVGYVKNAFFTIKDRFSFSERLDRSYKKGFWSNYLIKDMGMEGVKRINPINRGLIVYSRNFKLFINNPFIFLTLIAIKNIEFLSFAVGYFVGSIQRISLKDIENNTA